MKKQPDNDAYDLRTIFEKMELELIQGLKRTFKLHTKEEEKEGFKWEQWQRSKLRNLRNYRKKNEEIINFYSKKADDAINKVLQSSYTRGKRMFQSVLDRMTVFFGPQKHVQFPKDAKKTQKDYEKPEKDFFGINDKKLSALQETIKNDIHKAQHAVLRCMDDVYRQTIYRAEINMSAGAKTLSQAIDMATKEFLNKGIDCIEYKNGKRVNIASYAEMALRTASQRATFLAEGKKRDEWKIHTVFVSAHANTCPKCAPWQGKILVDDVFSSGTKEEARELGYPLLSEAIKAGLLHPNCRHTIATYFLGITQLPKVPDVEKATDLYKEEQVQRGLENKIRKAKRKVAGVSDKDNLQRAKEELKELQTQLREHIKKHPELRRDLRREKMYAIS